METFLSFLIAALITLFFVRRYVRNLGGGAPAAAAPPAVSSQPCPRCGKALQAGTTFCAYCGAPLALWNVQRASVQESGGAAPAGKPRPVINASLCIGCGSCVDDCPEAGTLALAGGKAILAHPERCVGHAKCVEVCPTQAISLSFGGVLQTMRVPMVRENFETNVPGVYIIGELGGVGLIKTGINEGKLVVDYLKRDMDGRAPALDGIYDVVIVGSGPAGLSASLTAHQYGLKYVVLEQGEIADTIRQYPRHKLVMAEPLEMPLYGSLYIGDGSKDALLRVWETIIANTGVEIRTGTRVESVERNGRGFHVHTTQGEFCGRTVILATGRRGTPRRLGVPGEDLPKVTYKLIEADTYSDIDALVVGGGDSAVESALALAKGGRNRVTLSYRGATFQRVRERNRGQLEAAEREGRLRVLRSSNVREIGPDSVMIDCAGAGIAIPNQFVFVLIGGESPEGFLRRIGVEIVEKAVAAA